MSSGKKEIVSHVILKDEEPPKHSLYHTQERLGFQKLGIKIMIIESTPSKNDILGASGFLLPLAVTIEELMSNIGRLKTDNFIMEEIMQGSVI